MELPRFSPLKVYRNASDTYGWLIVAVLVFVTTMAFYYGQSIIGTACNFNARQYEERISKLTSLRTMALYFNNPVQDKSNMLHAGVPLHKVIYEFPSNGDYSDANRDKIRNEIQSHITETELTQHRSNVAVNRIWIILIVQLLFFDVAVLHTLVSGCLIRDGVFDHDEEAALHESPSPFQHVFSHISDNSSSILLTLGIGGTFWGLMEGLGNSMAGQASGFNVPALFLGLKISFASTLIGVFLSIVARLTQQALSGPSKTIDSLDEQIGKLRSNVEGAIFDKVREATEEHFNGTRNTIIGCANQMERCAESMETIQTRVEVHSKQIANHIQQLADSASELGKLNNKAKTYKKTFEDINSVIPDINDSLETAREESDQLYQSIGAMTSVQDEFLATLKSSHARINDLFIFMDEALDEHEDKALAKSDRMDITSEDSEN